MPTPFYHIHLAWQVLNSAGLPGAVRTRLQRHQGAFLFGCTAPDVQTVTGQPRGDTHFFDLPIFPGARPPWEEALRGYPMWASPRFLPGEQAAFLAGYLCHLQADWYWVQEIFAPVFGPRPDWHGARHRLYLHNVLRAYLDQRVLESIPASAAPAIQSFQPHQALPFASDESLRSWRDQLAAQLAPGGTPQTVEVFAARQGIPAEDYYGLISSEERLDQEIFSRLPRQTLEAYRQRTLGHHLRLLMLYLQ